MKLHRTHIALMLLGFVAASSPAAELFDESTIAFAGSVDIEKFAPLAVQYLGRATVLDTVARGELAGIAGGSSIDGTSPVFGYLELTFNAGKYLDKPIVYIKSARMRKLLSPDLSEAGRLALDRDRRLSPALVMSRAGMEHLLSAGRATAADFDRASELGSLKEALGRIAADRANMLYLERLQGRVERFIVLSPSAIPTGRSEWLSPDMYAFLIKDPAIKSRMGESVANLAGQWTQLREAWAARDSAAVNRLISAIENNSAQLAGGANRPVLAGRLELAYNRIRRDKISLIGFAITLILAVAAAATGKKWTHAAAITALVAVAIWMVAGFVVRWIISGRSWYLPPMMNQYEAVLGSVMLAAMAGAVLELATRRGIFALAASLYGVIALIAALLLGEKMDPSISVAHGILNSPVMAVHVAVIIIGHAMVGMTGVISLIYLVGFGIIGRSESPGLVRIDRANLIVAKIAALTMVTGTALGAYWADMAWGRWWGWDNKETWALITCAIFLAALHLRMVIPASRRGPVTAVCCLLGCAAMLFNWIVVNYLMSGLHSYS